MGVADEAASWLYNKGKQVINGEATVEQTNTLSEAPPVQSSQQDQELIQMQIVSKRAFNARFDKWLKRIGAMIVGGGVAYYFLAMRKKSGGSNNG